MKSIFRSTPVKQYELNGKTIHVKREDLCCPKGSPRFAKIRGLEKHLITSNGNGVNHFGVLDSIHSKAGWGTAWLCKQMDLQCTLYYPVRKHEPGYWSDSQVHAEALGAELVSIPAGRQSVLWYQARKMLGSTDSHAEMLPNGLTLPECAEATYQECIHTPIEYFGGTVIVSTSTGTIASGVAFFLKQKSPETKMIIHMGYDRSERTVKRIVNYQNVSVINEGYEYKDKAQADCPFPCNPYYDLKAWKWLSGQKSLRLKEPILFWNIGA